MNAWQAAGLGLLSGLTVAGLFFVFGQKKVDDALEAAVRATIDREVPPRVRAELDLKVCEIGLDRATGTRINRLLASADRAGII